MKDDDDTTSSEELEKLCKLLRAQYAKLVAITAKLDGEWEGLRAGLKRDEKDLEVLRRFIEAEDSDGSGEPAHYKG